MCLTFLSFGVVGRDIIGPVGVALTEVQQYLSEEIQWPGAIILGGAGIIIMLLLAGGLYLLNKWLRRRTSRFEQMVAAAPTPMLLLDQNLRVVQVNDVTKRTLGEDVVQRNFQHVLEHLGKPDWTRLPKRIEFEEKISFRARNRKESSDTHYRVEMSGVKIEEKPYYMAVVHDVTEEQGKVELFKAFHHQTINQLPIEVGILTPEGKYLHTNAEFAQGLVSKEWLMQKTDVDLCQELGWHPEIALRRRSHRKRAVAMEERIHLKESVEMPDGSRRQFERFYAPLFDQEGEIYAVATFGLDSTAVEELSRRLQAIDRKEEDFEALKERFLKNLSHEFRTPLTGIKGASEILQQEVKSDQKDLVDIIEQSGRRLLNTLNAMLDLAGLGAEELDMRPQVLDLAYEVETVVDDLQEDAEEKDLFLRAHAMQEEVLARLDPVSLKRVLSSLIGNAIKFTEEGGVLVEIDEEEDHAEIRIMDTGVGIQDDFIPYLFQAFRQEQESTGGKFEGIGVGLSVVKHLIERMKGEVSVDTEKGEGSMFSVSFPKAFTEISDGDQHRPHLLVIEGDSDAQQLFRRLLEPHFQTDIARDLEAVRKRSQLASYDVVLMDVRLREGQAAADLLDEVKAFDGLSVRPVVAVDKQSKPGAREQYLAIGFDHYLDEPFEKQVLLSKLGDALSSAEVLSHQ